MQARMFEMEKNELRVRFKQAQKKKLNDLS